MAIHPPSDLILDVARAADPAAAQAAADRLKAMAANMAGGTGTASTSLPARFEVEADAPATPAAVRIVKPQDPYAKFESFVLQTFIQSMFSGEDDKDVFGEGSAGQYWRSMLAGAIADNMARSGGIGIASMLRTETGRHAGAAAQAGARAEKSAG